MTITIFIFIVIVAAITSLLEIQVEGPNGWAKNLPTWRSNPKKLSTKILCLLLNKKELTGYHLAFWAQVFLFFHMPLFWGNVWTISLETNIVANFLLFLMIEDFLWFVFNPAFGLKKFRPQNIPWHKKWWGFFPRGYYVTIILVIILYNI